MNQLYRRHTAAGALVAGVLVFAAAACLSVSAQMQQPSAPAPAAQNSQQPATAEPPTPRKGTVLFQSHGESPEPDSTPDPKRQLLAKPQASGPEFTDAERSAITVTRYDMDARLTPAASRMSMRAKLTLRNDSAAPLTRVALQISSTLQWESVSLFGFGGSQNLEFAQHLLDTDTDHTGKANEAVIVLPAPLAPGTIVELNTFYAGTVAQSGERLERIGATAEQALGADWDGIASRETALRGFGNVLWYPVASAQLFLGNGAELFDAIGRTELRESGATVRLRVGIEYSGDAPARVYFCGRRQELKAVSDNPDAPLAAGSGIAVAEFAAEPLGFRLPSLIVVEQPEQMIAPLPLLLPSGTQGISSSSSAASSSLASDSADAPANTTSTTSGQGAPMLATETENESVLTSLADAAENVVPFMQTWLGEKPLSALTIIDHRGQPFEDGPLLLAPAASLAVPDAAPALAHSLTHAWVQTGEPWMDEGLAQCMALLWTEHEKGRDTAVLQLNNLLQPLGIAEPPEEQGKPSPTGQPLVAATGEVFYRRKAAAVWFMLREIAGEQPLQAALKAWRLRSPAHAAAEQEALAFEALLEKTSGKDLHWFFDDWVLHDHGLPDLSITDVTARERPAGSGHGTGWLVSVSVRNEGGAAAEVPVIVRSGTFSTTMPLRIAAFSNATARVLVETAPTDVQVNDGVTPEISTSRHTRTVVPQKE